MPHAYKVSRKSSYSKLARTASVPRGVRRVFSTAGVSAGNEDVPTQMDTEFMPGVKRTSAHRAFTRRVVQVLRRQAEVKIMAAAQTFLPQTLQSASTSLAGNTCVCTPSSATGAFLNIAQGVADNQRIGNRIRVVSNKIRYSLVPLPYNATTNVSPQPQEVVMWFFRDKTQPTSNSLNVSTVLGPGGDILNHGNADAGLYGDLTDYMYVLNKDKYTYLTHRRFKLGFSTNGGTGVSNAYQSFANNDFKMNYSGEIDLTRYTPKEIVWEDTNTNPQSKNILCLIQVVAADGQTNATTALTCSLTMVNEMKYSDL